MSKRIFEKKSSKILSVLGNPFRVRLVFALATHEACVCHLEQMLNKRQAYISQHLMVLREAGLLETRRDGKYIYYRLSSPQAIDIIGAAAKLAGIDPNDFPQYEIPEFLEKCECPNCGSEEDFSNVPNAISSINTK